MSIAVSVQELTFKYGGNTVIDGMTLNINPGTFISIIGPNGSGKSTLLKNIAYVLKPDSGVIRLGDKNIQRIPRREIAQQVAVVPQETAIEFRFSVMDIVMMGRNPYLKRFQKEDFTDHQIVKQVMEQTDTWKLRDRFINELSGGERQRVIIARALAQEPSLILLDEPTSSLDLKHQIEVLELLERLNKENKLTVIAILHDMNLASRYSRELLLLRDGKIVALGTPEQVISYENLKSVYHIDIQIHKNLCSGIPYVIPLSTLKKDVAICEQNIHLICGGGTGTELIQKLKEKGCALSMGVLNMGDSDWETGKLYEVPMVAEAPFTAIQEKSHERNLKQIQTSDVVILAPVPIGVGNLKNLEAVEWALDHGKKAMLLEVSSGFERYDYTNGEGIQILQRIRDKGGQFFQSLQEVLDNLDIS